MKLKYFWDSKKKPNENGKNYGLESPVPRRCPKFMQKHQLRISDSTILKKIETKSYWEALSKKRDWFWTQINEKQGIGLLWFFSTLWVQEYSMDGFNSNVILSKENWKPVLTNSRNSKIINVNVSVKKHKIFHLKRFSVRKNYETWWWLSSEKKWYDVAEVSFLSKNCCFGHFENKNMQFVSEFLFLWKFRSYRKQSNAAKLGPETSNMSYGK